MLTEPVDARLRSNRDPGAQGCGRDPPTPPARRQSNARRAVLAPIEKRRQLQVALYLRLRQRLDQELEAALADNLRRSGSAVDQAIAQLARELRNVLPHRARIGGAGVCPIDQGGEWQADCSATH